MNQTTTSRCCMELGYLFAQGKWARYINFAASVPNHLDCCPVTLQLSA